MTSTQIHLRQQGRSSLQFLGSLRAVAAGELRSTAKSLFDKNPHGIDLQKQAKQVEHNSPGQWMRLIKKADSIAREHPIYRLERFYQHHGGREIWSRGICAIEACRREIEDSWEKDTNGADLRNLELNPDLSVPDWFDVEWHTQPGGWDAYDLYSALFQYGFGPYVFSPGGYAAVDPGQQGSAWRDQVCAAMPKTSYKSIFEPGCGAGGMLMSAKKNFPHAEIVGCDLSEGFLRHGWRISENAGLNIKFRQCLADKTGEPEGYFDAVMSFATFHEMPGPYAKKVISEMFRILRPGGDFLICDPPPYKAISLFQGALLHHETLYHDEPYFSSYCATDWGQVLCDAGFTQVHEQSLYDGPGKFPYIYVGTKPA